MSALANITSPVSTDSFMFPISCIPRATRLRYAPPGGFGGGEVSLDVEAGISSSSSSFPELTCNTIVRRSW